MMLFVGIDIAKRRHAAMLMDEQGNTVVKPFFFNNDREGINKLLGYLQQHDQPIAIALESTSHYWLAVYDQLQKAGYSIHVFNPIQIRNFRRTDIRKRKNDRLDSIWIAEFLRINIGRIGNSHEPIHLQLKQLARFRLTLSDALGDAKRRITALLDMVFPEYEQFFSDLFIASSRALLTRALSPQEFASFDLEEMTQLIKTASRGYYGHKKAEEIQRVARDSIGVSFMVDVGRIQLNCLLAQLDFIEAQIAEVDAKLNQLVNDLPENHLTSIPGIGPTAAAIFLGEIGNVERFDNADQLVAYAGIDPSVFASGEFEGTRAHMSKRGSSYLRRALWLSSTMVRMKDPEIRAFYKKKRAEGKHYGTAMGAVCRKLMVRIYVILKQKRPYEIRQIPSESQQLSA